MQANDIIKTIMSEKHITQGEMTKMLQMASQSGVSQALNRDMRISMLLRFAEVLNSEVVIRTKDGSEEWIIQ